MLTTYNNCVIQIMILFSHWLILICCFGLLVYSVTHFLRRVGAFRRVVRRVRRGFRRVQRKVGRAFRRVKRVQRKFAKTDPKVFNSIKTASSNTMKEVLDSKGTQRVREKDIKKEVKNKVAIKVEREIQESPMRDMRPLVDKTIDETINLAVQRHAPITRTINVPTNLTVTAQYNQLIFKFFYNSWFITTRYYQYNITIEGPTTFGPHNLFVTVDATGIYILFELS